MSAGFHTRIHMFKKKNNIDVVWHALGFSFLPIQIQSIYTVYTTMQMRFRITFF